MLHVSSIDLVLPYTGTFKFTENNINEFFDVINSRAKNERDLLYAGVNIVLDEDEEQVSEMAVQQNKDTVSLYYIVPKKVAFTKKFQDRIKKEVPDIIESVYPGLYDVYDISYIEESKNDMKLNIKVKAKTSDAINNIYYLDDNVSYIVDDIIEYYL